MHSEQKKTTSKLMSFFLFICLSIAVVALSGMAYLSNKGIDVESLSIEDVKTIFLKGGLKTQEGVLVGEFGYKQAERPTFTIYKNYIVKCGNDSMKYFSTTGEVLFDKNISLKTPIVRTNGTELLVTDMGSKEISVFKDKDLKWSAKIEGAIINVDISSAGYVAVVHEIKGYKSAVTVFNLQGSPFYTRNIVENFALSAKVSSKAQSVAVSLLDTSGIASKAVLEITSILGNPSGDKLTNIEDFFSHLFYLDGEIAIASGSKYIVAVDKLNKEKWKYEAEEGKIIGTCQADSKNIVAVISNNEKTMLKEEQNIKVLKFNVEGKRAEIFKASKGVKSINSNDGIIALNYGNNIDFISTSGRLTGTYKPAMEVVEVLLMNSDEAAVITKSAVEIINIH